MRRRSLVTILGASGVVGLVAVLAVVLATGEQWEESAASSIVVSIPDNPATEAQDAEVVAMLPGAEQEAPQHEQEEAASEPEAPQDLSITDTLRQTVDDPVLHKGAQADDIAAVRAFYGSHTGPALWLNTAGISPRGQALLGELGRAGEWGLDPSLFRVPPPDYKPAVAEDQAATEIAISLAALKYARAARGWLVDPSALKKNFDQTPTLRDPAVVMTEIAASQAPDIYLTDLHPKHEQFTRLRQALAKAQSKQDVTLIEANMDRWRWMPEQMGASYVWLNIPEFMLHVVKDGKTVASEKIAVGNYNSPTPVLSADLTAVIFNPERTVPLSVIRRDVLPKLRKGNWFGGSDTSVLDAYQITVKKRGKRVDPSTINWDKVNPATLTFVQAPGRTNVLGKVQFLYPNDRGVFMHDTILRGQLARDVRAEGSKEPRVSNPGKLAGVLLAEDKGWSQSKVNQLIASGKTTRVQIDKSIPVHTTYFTAVVDETGEVKTFDDVYKLDKRNGPGDEAAAAQPRVAGSAPTPTRKPMRAATAP
ncbi:MAG: L,D-transpeptidase family protein [Alphaproteobacteria bacterium]